MTPPTKFSIIIPTLNEQKALPILLADLAEQSNQNFEVIVVDGQSTDKTRQEYDKFLHRHPHLSAQFITTSLHNVSAQRNLGAKKARHPWLIFMDADNQLQPFFLQGIAYQIEKKGHKVDFFTTLIHLNKQDHRHHFYRTIANGLNLFATSRDRTRQPFAFGALIGIRHSVFQKHSFDEKNKVMEDVIFVKKLHKAGFHFQLFSEPTFAYSMRRIKHKGLFKTARSSFLMQMRLLLGDEFTESDCGYEMLGGEQYRQK